MNWLLLQVVYYCPNYALYNVGSCSLGRMSAGHYHHHWLLNGLLAVTGLLGSVCRSQGKYLDIVKQSSLAYGFSLQLKSLLGLALVSLGELIKQDASRPQTASKTSAPASRQPLSLQ